MGEPRGVHLHTCAATRGLKVKVKVTQLCLTLCHPMDYTVYGSPDQNTEVGSLSVFQGIFPIQGSNLGLPHCWWILYQLSHKGSPRILEWVAYPFSSGTLTEESNRGLLHCRRILYQLSSQGNQRFSDEIKQWDSYCALANEGDGEATQGILLTRILFFSVH